jgi:hypothetical protein
MDRKEEPHMCMYGEATDRIAVCQTCKVQVMMKYRSENRNPCGVIRRAGGHKSLWIRSRCSHGAPEPDGSSLPPYEWLIFIELVRWP